MFQILIYVQYWPFKKTETLKKMIYIKNYFIQEDKVPLVY